jgi:hypothetical protein
VCADSGTEELAAGEDIGAIIRVAMLIAGEAPNPAQ